MPRMALPSLCKFETCNVCWPLCADWTQLRYLTKLNIANNSLSGAVPSSWELWASTSLTCWLPRDNPGLCGALQGLPCTDTTNTNLGAWVGRPLLGMGLQYSQRAM